MQAEFSKRERRCIRELAELAWERELRAEIMVVGAAIRKMENDEASPHSVNDIIHKFHNGESRDLYNKYTGTVPWLPVCSAYNEGILTDDDLADASDHVREKLRETAISLQSLNRRPMSGQ